VATCESCGADVETVYPVHRKYVTPEAWDMPGTSKTLAETEHWCFPCCTHYPHEPAT